MILNNRYLLHPLIIFIIGLFSFSVAAQTNTVSGYVYDANNGESLIGATIYVDEGGQGTTSNEYGFYSLTLASGNYTLRYSYIGFSDLVTEIVLDKNIVLNQNLSESASELDEVVVLGEAKDKNVRDIQMSVNKLDMAVIKKLPSFMGETELLRSIQLLPGVTSVGEGAAGFNVRGGSIDQNLVLLDESPVYNSSHLFGFFSVFNPDAVKDAKLFKGGMPSRYGGRLSSILDVRMKEGNNKRFTVNGGVGFIFSRLSIEAPIVKDKSSFILAGRRSYADILAKPFLNDDLDGSALNFYDLTLKTNYKINDKNQLFLSGYFGRDNFIFGDDAGFNWGNKTTTLRWNHVFNEKLFSNLTFYFSDYDYKLNFGDTAEDRFDWDAKIVNLSLKSDFSYFLSPTNVLRFGGQVIDYKFEPANAVLVSDNQELDISVDERYAIESNLYVEDEIEIGSRLKLNYGLRWSHFNYVGGGFNIGKDRDGNQILGSKYIYGGAEPGESRPILDKVPVKRWESIQTYHNFEPRLSIKYQLNGSTSLKASYNRTAQYIHLISNSAASTPVDVWTPSTNNIKPQKADQVAAGYFKNFKENTYEFSAEIYYKRMYDLVDYTNGADLVLNEFVEGEIISGTGRAYGLELMLKKNEGKLYGWASYTLSKSERQVIGVSKNNWYPSRFDQTHNFSLTGLYDLSDRVTFGATFAYISGTPVTFPTSRFSQLGYVIPHNSDEDRNNFRIPAYHRLDLSVTIQGKKNKTRRRQGEWVFAVYNVYSKKNPFAVYFKQEGNRVPSSNPVETDAIRLSVIGNYIPSIAYNFKF